MAFDEVRFPTDIAYSTGGGPMFSTRLARLANSHERRNEDWTEDLQRWDVASGIKTIAQMEEILTFFKCRRGMSRGFRFKIHDDYIATDEAIGTGDSAELDFQLMTTVTDSGSFTYSKTIIKPVSGTVVVKRDAVVEPESNWTVDTTTGIVSFITGAVPLSGEAITASFQFDLPVRFDTDYLPRTLTSYQLREAQVPIQEVRE